MHHLPNTADLPNTVTTTAFSSIAIAPQNYFSGDISRRTSNGVRVDFDEKAKIVDRIRFGTQQPTCAYDMVNAAPDLSSFVGEVIIPKFPGIQVVACRRTRAAKYYTLADYGADHGSYKRR